ncbi:MAG: hypothetical protein WCO42_07425, partial [bacterium]
NQALVGNPAVILQQGAVETEIDAQHLGDTDCPLRGGSRTLTGAPAISPRPKLSLFHRQS